MERVKGIEPLFQEWLGGFFGASPSWLSVSAFISFGHIGGETINGLTMDSMDSFTHWTTDLFRRARLVHCRARLRLSRLSDNFCLALRAGGSVCGSTVERFRRAKDVAG
jgi:hypothetical protein